MNGKDLDYIPFIIKKKVIVLIDFNIFNNDSLLFSACIVKGKGFSKRKNARHLYDSVTQSTDLLSQVQKLQINKGSF